MQQKENMTFKTGNRLSKNFTLKELCATSHSKFLKKNRKGAQDPAIKRNLWFLVNLILQPIRDKFGVIRINSGYRSPDLNSAIGGSKTSQHMYGEAADIFPKKEDCQKVFNWIKDESGIEYGQLILEERNGVQWIHISLPRPYRPIKQNLIATFAGGKMIYREVLKKTG